MTRSLIKAAVRLDFAAERQGDGVTLIAYMPELDYRKEISDHIRKLDYYLSESGIARACQKISDELNSANYDIHGVWVSMSQFGPAQGHFHHFEVEAEGSTFYVRVTVD